MTQIEKVSIVVEQIINMYNNNVLAEYGNEDFENWCENGEVFSDYQNKEELIGIMKRLTNSVNNLTNEIEKLLNEE